MYKQDMLHHIDNLVSKIDFANHLVNFALRFIPSIEAKADCTCTGCSQCSPFKVCGSQCGQITCPNGQVRNVYHVGYRYLIPGHGQCEVVCYNSTCDIAESIGVGCTSSC